jgi:hypothetical protein
MRAIFWIVTVVCPGVLSAQRSVAGNRLVSTELPAATLEVDEKLRYAGTQTFDLYGVATAEQHFFVELDGNRIKRLLWVQYEGYLPSNANTYNYRDSTVVHSGHSWHRRIAASRLPDSEARPDSDGGRARAFLRAKGWTVGPELLTERLVWIQDDPARHELMLIYLEDLGDQHLTAAELGPSGPARAQWARVADGFHARALAAFKVIDR